MTDTAYFIRVDGSFRDPNGFLVFQNQELNRIVRPRYRPHYDFLKSSGLYDELIDRKWLIRHAEKNISEDNKQKFGDVYRILQPDLIPFVSYPYEWSFGQLRAAALLTLDIQKAAFAKGMTLKDSPAHNVQFIGCRPVFIDTLSFEIREKGAPWIAYRQFCQHYLAPLLLMARDYRLVELLSSEIDGIELDLASRLLPWSSYFSLGKLMHIHLHARAQKKYAGASKPAENRKIHVSDIAFLGLIDSLKSTIKSIKYRPGDTEWGDYYTFTNYSESSFSEKEKAVNRIIEVIKPQMVWDFGANDGHFSKIAADAGCYTVAMDIDPIAVEKNFQANSDNDFMLPLKMDLRNPSPGNGWDNSERKSLSSRGPVDLALALALIHHLAISNNVPLKRLAEWFAKHCKRLLIEFVPKEDSKVQTLLATREDIFPDYNEVAFEHEFSVFFNLEEKIQISGSERKLYLFNKK